MKIVLTLHHVLDINAGAASVVIRLRDEYRQLGHQVQILSYDNLPKSAKKLADIVFPLLVAWRLATRYRDFDIVDAGSGDGWLAFSLPRWLVPQLRVTHSHGLEHLSAARELSDTSAQGLRPTLSKRIWRYGLRLRQVIRSFSCADLALVLNDAETDFLARRGISSAKIRRAHLGIGLTPLATPRARADSPLVMVQLGTYTARKGIEVTRAALSSVLNSHPDCRMIFAGTGVDAARVHAAYPPEMHERIQVVPRYRNEDLPGLLEEASVLLMPSLFEGYGIAKLEAMSQGVVPVVSDDPGTAADMVDGVNALVVPVGDPTALVAAIERLRGDRALLASLATAAIETAAQAQWPMIARNRIALYQELLGRHRQAG